MQSTATHPTTDQTPAAINSTEIYPCFYLRNDHADSYKRCQMNISVKKQTMLKRGQKKAKLTVQRPVKSQTLFAVL